MTSKKTVELKCFNEFDENSSNIQTKNFYNYLPCKTLKNSINFLNRIFLNPSHLFFNKKTEEHKNIN